MQRNGDERRGRKASAVRMNRPSSSCSTWILGHPCLIFLNLCISRLVACKTFRKTSGVAGPFDDFLASFDDDRREIR